VLLLASCAAVDARDREFDALVRSMEQQLGGSKTHIPLMGFVNFCVKVGRPGGASGLKLAVFENLPAPVMVGNEDFDRIMERAGGNWRPFVRVISKRDKEASYVYSNIDGNDWKLLIATREPDEAAVVQLKLDAAGLKCWLGDPVRMGRSRHSHE
jgi:hypothetical protein